MPALFMGHGNPMNAISDNQYTRTWSEITAEIPKPSAIVCISAHWESRGTKVTAVQKPKMIYDMYGFPEQLYKVRYDCPGSPEDAGLIRKSVKHTTVEEDHEWGLDHGAWSLLVKMYPEADIPCIQLSLNRTRDMRWHYDLGRELAFLRKKGVLVIGSGNAVHNLQYASFGSNKPYDWALEFDNTVAEAINRGDHNSLIHYDKFGKPALLSVNSAEHYIPLLYTLGMQSQGEKVMQFNEGIDLGSAGMRCVRIG